jgi:hypothetical protein
VIDPVAGAWPESKDGSIKAKAERAQEKGMRFIYLVNIPSQLPCGYFDLTKSQDDYQPCRVTDRQNHFTFFWKGSSFSPAQFSFFLCGWFGNSTLGASIGSGAERGEFLAR